MEQEKTFGQWLRAWRLEQGLTLKDLEIQVGVKNGPLSRIENELHEVTLSTVIRICEGLGMTADDLFSALHGRRKEPQGLEQVEGMQYRRSVLTSDDVIAFLRLYHDKPEAGVDILVSLSAIVAGATLLERDRIRKRKEEQEGPSNIPSITLQPHEAEKVFITALLSGYSLRETSDIKYPPSIETSTITEINKQGGVIIEEDILEYLYHTKLEPPNTTKSDRRYENLRSRLETASVERCKLADVLWLDESFGAEGQLLGMFWNVSSFRDRIADEIATEYGKRFANWCDNLFVELIKICRWLQFLNEDTPWLEDLRRKISISQVL
jgi:transcriptional regulator with XRE-family HTH domain